MSKILEHLDAQLTGRKAYPEMDMVNVKVTDLTPFSQDITLLHEYRIMAQFGSTVQCLPKDKDLMLNNVYNTLREDIYGEFRKRILELERAIYEQDRERISMLLRDIMRLTGV